MKKSDDICKPLPYEISKQASTLDNRERFIIDFLEQRLPSTDSSQIIDELKKTFVLDKLRANKKIKPKKGNFLSGRKRKLLGIKTVGLNKKLKYKDLLPLNKLWLEYFSQTLGVNFKELPNPGDNDWESINQKIMKSDFHGAKVKVVKSKCPSLIDIQGIIVQDTKNTFRIVSEDDTVRTVPKHAVAIDIQLIETKFQLFGKDLCIRPAERVKIKNKFTPSTSL
ncbi:ribonuclease P protein subunit p29 [Microplitis mediator]|uniref:ribonuclease P protein subunit p29 n=1 Tax=Microplitis mediator TaxID=375433 RepID=UPI002554FC69|nr:ribonuclease P protein subunit p29 [Microplitis mediator]